MTGPKPWLASDGGEGDRRYAPATQRNRDAISDVLRPVLPAEGVVVEVASGSGEHVLHFAGLFPRLIWQPSDVDPAARDSIAAWTQGSGLANIRPPVAIDAARDLWPVARADAILCINMVHISPWAATVGLFAGAARLLPPGGLLYLYGPYLVPGIVTAPSNIAFDESLKARDPAWGLRSLDAMTALSRDHGFGEPDIVSMPANNLSLIFHRL